MMSAMIAYFLILIDWNCQDREKDKNEFPLEVGYVCWWAMNDFPLQVQLLMN